MQIIANKPASQKLKNTQSTSNNPFSVQRPGDLSQSVETLQKLFSYFIEEESEIGLTRVKSRGIKAIQ